MKYTTVSIPYPLNKKLQKTIKKTGFSSTSSFVVFVLREVLAEGIEDSLLSNKAKVRERLKSLGYLAK